MRTYLINLFKYVAIATLVLPCALAFGQVTPAATAVNEIIRLENVIKERKALAQTRLELESLYKRAANANNYVLQARSLNSLIKVKDQLTEDSLYFRNSAVIDTLLASAKTPPALKSILFVMQAKRISRFDQRPRRFGMDSYRVKNLPTDYTALTFLQRIQLSVKLLDSALAGAAPKPQDTAQFKWLASNPDFLLFTTRLEDVALLEKANIASLNTSLALNLHKTFRKILTLPSDAFAHAVDSLISLKRDEPALHALKAYQEWIALHRTENETKLFIEALARKSIYLYVEGDTVVNRRYIDYLQSQLSSKYDAIKAFAVYHLCLLWNQEGNRYKNFADRYMYSPQFEARYQYYPTRALQFYEQHKLLMAKYPPLATALETMVTQIKAKALRIEMEDTFVPGDAIPFKVTYKNTDSLYYRIVMISPQEPAGNALIIANDALIRKSVVTTGNFALPLPADNNVHATYLKLAALPAGRYRLLTSYRPINAAKDTLNNICFKVTGIVALNTDDRVFVLDRKTGSPLIDAGVQAFDPKTKVKTSGFIKIPTSGYITVKNLADSLTIINMGDTLGYKPTASRNQINSNIYDKANYDDLSEFYGDNVRMQVFVDRGIYRPGQTIHYKIIFFTNHPKTGQSVLLNKENMGGGVFKTMVKNWLNNGDDHIRLLDVFNKKIDSARLTINEFGSFAGSFVIPKTAATGQWHIVGSPQTDYQNSGLFKVEEYKRPTIALSMEKQKKMLLPGQQFTIKLKLRSFNGSDLNNRPISYTITRMGNIPSNKPDDEYERNQNDEKLLDTTGYTDALGELKITVYDTALAKAKLTDTLYWGYVYNVKAKAVDVTGESTEINDATTVTSRPVNINVDMVGTIDRHNLPAIGIQTTNDFEGKLKRNVNVKIYRLNEPPQGNAIKQVDQWYYKEQDWNAWFPEKSTSQIAKPRVLVLDTVVNTGINEKLVLNKEKLEAGLYQLEANTRDGEHTLGQFSRRFNVFDSKAGEWVGDDINYFNLNTAKAGDEATWFTSGRSENFSIYRSVYVNKKRKTITQYQTLLEKPGIRQWRYRVPDDATGTILVSKVSVKNNQLLRSEQRVYIPPVSANPEIIVERYRRVLAPGAEEKFTVSIKTKNENTAAELMTTVYDASLDKLVSHYWQLPSTASTGVFLQNNWTYAIKASVFAENYPVKAYPVNLFRYSASDRENSILYATVARLNGMDYSGDVLKEISIVGYGTQRRQTLTGAISGISIRGNSSSAGLDGTRVRLNGKDFTGDVNSILPADIVDMIVLKGADAAQYGDEASKNGIVLISTTGPLNLTEPPAPVVKVRKNFNETAFFFPQIHAGRDGFYSFSFTMPETAAEWNWKMLAHTKDARFAYLEKKLQTQLNLMVQPNMPRLLYQGDKINLQSRISNLDTFGVQGKATIKIEDAVTGEDITRLLTANAAATFSLDKKSTGAIAFMLSVPATQANPLKVVITATGGGVADAEEHIIPILSSKVFVRQSVPVRFDDKATITINQPKLPADVISYGIGISINQQPQASLIYALPWLANYTFDCAEQTLNKLRAQATALKLMQNDTTAQNAFKKAKAFMEQEQSKTDALPDEMADETMPWLSLTNNTAVQQKQLFRLLDTSVTKANMDKHWRSLYALQKADGGLSWFEGGESNAYISAYVLAGIGQLRLMSLNANNNLSYLQKNFTDRLISYGQSQLLTDATNGTDKNYTLYALSYWLKERPASTDLLQRASKFLEKEWSRVGELTLQQQALLIINTIRFLPAGSPTRAEADKQLENIRQLAIQDDVNGIRWKAIADAENMNTSAEETMAVLAEAFELSGKYKEVQQGMVKWLLTAKQQQHWRTTKATAAAIDMLQKQKGGVFERAKSFSANVNGKPLNVNDALLDGKPADFIATKEIPANITLKQTGTNATGALTWYYFAKPEGLDTLNKTVKINKQFFIYDGNSRNTKAITPGTVLKPGDKLQVKLTVEAAMPLQYIHISDARAALFEPGENSSGYQHTKGVGYYQSVRDTGMELFTEAIPRGRSEFVYDVVVAHSGEFSSGPATLQCMYQPALTAYSSTHSFKAD